jgi:hypothetical protein
VAGYGLMHDATTVTVMTIRVRDEDLRHDHEASQRVVRHWRATKFPRARTVCCVTATPYPTCRCPWQWTSPPICSSREHITIRRCVRR